MRREGKEGWDREWERIGERDRKITLERDMRRERREGVSQIYWTDIAIYKRASLNVATYAGRGTSRLRWQCVLPSAGGGGRNLSDGAGWPLDEELSDGACCRVVRGA